VPKGRRGAEHLQAVPVLPVPVQVVQVVPIVRVVPILRIVPVVQVGRREQSLDTVAVPLILRAQGVVVDAQADGGTRRCADTPG
jgi:hypothetical protein